MRNLFILCLASCSIIGSISAQCIENNTLHDQELKTIRIPVGGIATGDILVGGRGNIEYIEVFNRPDRQRKLEKTYFSLWVKEQGKKPKVTLLERELFPPFPDATHNYAWGLPRMTEAKFMNNYPQLQWQFKDDAIPLDISLHILNPVVPLDFESSNYPVCRFSWKIKNPTDKSIEASIALNMENPVEAEKIITEYINNENIEGVRFFPEGDDVPVNYQGSFLIGTPADGAEIQTHWYPGTWRDETHIFWEDFSDDGQMGTKVRVYRDWKLSGDNDWLAKLWPDIKKSLEFAWTGSGIPSKDKVGALQSGWDPEKTGLLSGEQHNTYDINFYGPCSMTSSTYLAALKAGSEMALAMGEKKKSRQYLDVFVKGSGLLVDSLWNGGYFIQAIVDEPGLYDEHQLSPPDEHGKRIPKYQYGNGCLADQLFGQYLAFNAGLGYIAEKEKVNKAIESVYKYNFFESLREFSNVQRVFGLNDEAGVVLCTWPHGNQPVLPFVYAQEIWTGVEYQVAASLIYSGKIEEGLKVVKAVDERYNGSKRNPFEHNESGVHYARALASWSVLLALSGIEYNGVTEELAFSPKINTSDYRSFWSTNSAWGEIVISKKEAKLEVIHGTLSLKKLTIQGEDAASSKTRIYKNGKTVQEGEVLVLAFKE